MSTVSSASTTFNNLLASIFKNKIADQNKDGKLNDSESALFTYDSNAKAFSDGFSPGEGEKVDWRAINDSLDALVESGLKAHQKAASEMYKIDIDQNKLVELEDDIGEIEDGNPYSYLDNVFENVPEAVRAKALDGFDIEEILRYISLVDLNNDGVISKTEEAEIGKLLSLTGSIRRGGVTATSAQIAKAIALYVSDSEMNDEQKKIIDNIKSGKYRDNDTWNEEDGMPIELSESTRAFEDALNVDLGVGQTLHIYDMDGKFDPTSTLTKTNTRILILIKDSSGNVVGEYRLPVGYDITNGLPEPIMYTAPPADEPGTGEPVEPEHPEIEDDSGG